MIYAKNARNHGKIGNVKRPSRKRLHRSNRAYPLTDYAESRI